uniref:Uncharacterized protein n=1 Tax=Arion vulgaris TaxID=1028688 RepID=A0A0B7A4L8_9EUPU
MSSICYMCHHCKTAENYLLATSINKKANYGSCHILLVGEEKEKDEVLITIILFER